MDNKTVLECWKKIDSEVILSQDRYGKQLYQQRYQRPRDGHEEIFTHFRQRDWSVVLPITEDRLVITVIQYKQGCDCIVRELPAGTSESSNETPEARMRRELLQETGYESKEVIALNPPQFIATRNSPTRFFPFLALSCLKTAEARLDHIEDILTELVPLEHWVQMCLMEIVEPSAIVTTFRGLPYLKNKYNLNLNIIISR